MEMTLGAHTFTIESTDVYDPDATVYVLDSLRFGWTTDEAAPAPANPNPVTATLQLLTPDVANLAGLECGTPAYITLKSAGNLIASAAGRLAEPVVTSERRSDVQWALYTLVVVDYAADPAEVTITNLVRGAESGTARLAAIAAAAGITIDPGAADFDYPQFEAGTLNGPASQVINDHLWQMPQNFARPILMAETVDGVLTGYTAEPVTGPQVAMTWPPAEFAIIANKLTLDFAIPPHSGAVNSGMTIDAGQVDDEVSFRQSKGRNLNKVTVSNATAGTVTRELRSADDPVVELAIASTNTNIYVLESLATMFVLGAGVRDRWRVEGFAWEPSDTELANLQWPLTPDTETGDVTCLQAQVVIDGVPSHLNPSTALDFYAGTLDGAQVTVAGGRIGVALVLNHRLPRPIEVAPTPGRGITWGELRDQIGTTVKYRTGTNVVDPDLTWYESRLVRAEE